MGRRNAPPRPFGDGGCAFTNAVHISTKISETCVTNRFMAWNRRLARQMNLGVAETAEGLARGTVGGTVVELRIYSERVDRAMSVSHAGSAPRALQITIRDDPCMM